MEGHKNYNFWFALIFGFSTAMGIMYRTKANTLAIFLGIALISGSCFLFLAVGTIIEKRKKDKNLWYTDTLVADNNAIFVFGKDERPEAKEIVEYVRRLYISEVHYPVLKIFEVDTQANFWGNDFYCPFSTSESDYLCITKDGKFHRSNSRLDVLEEFEAISFTWLQELHRELGLQVEKLPDLSGEEW